MDQRDDRRLVRAVILAIAAINGMSVFAFWGEGSNLYARLLGGAVVATVTYLGARLLVS
jgi:hypothetical protein